MLILIRIDNWKAQIYLQNASEALDPNCLMESIKEPDVTTAKASTTSMSLILRIVECVLMPDMPLVR